LKHPDGKCPLSEHPLEAVKDRGGDHPQHPPGAADALQRLSVPAVVYNGRGAIASNLETIAAGIIDTENLSVGQVLPKSVKSIIAAQINCH
jgi:hypothetical protein